MTTTTVTACPIASTVADVERYIDALDRALDCPFIQEDDCCADLELLRGVLIGAEMMATRWVQSICPSVPFTNNTMRKIETLMNAAIKANKNWTNANTSVTTDDGVSTVYLHGNKIAEVGDAFVRIFDGGWQSNTTKSRLNAIINEFCCAFTDGVFQKDYAWYIRDNKVIHDFTNGYEFVEFA